jgi:hypothetical protein
MTSPHPANVSEADTINASSTAGNPKRKKRFVFIRKLLCAPCTHAVFPAIEIDLCPPLARLTPFLMVRRLCR